MITSSSMRFYTLCSALVAALHATWAATQVDVSDCSALIKGVNSTDVVFTLQSNIACDTRISFRQDAVITIQSAPGKVYNLTIAPTFGADQDSLIVTYGSLTVANIAFNSRTDGRARPIENYGTLAVSGCSFTMFYQRNGGAIYSNGNYFQDQSANATETESTPGGGSVAITNSVFSGNIAAYKGGAIFAGGSDPLIITNCQFILNTGRYTGGSVYAQDTTPVTITNSLFSQSRSDYEGAALYICGGTMTNTTVDSCQAPHGGAVVSTGDQCPPLKLLSSTFSNNKADSTGGVGGAVKCISGNLDIDGCHFTNNYAYHTGGALYMMSQGIDVLNIANTVFSGNQAGDTRVGAVLYFENTLLNTDNLGSITGVQCSGNEVSTCEMLDSGRNLKVSDSDSCNYCDDDVASQIAAQEARSKEKAKSTGLIAGLSVGLGLAVVGMAVLVAWKVHRGRRLMDDMDDDDRI